MEAGIGIAKITFRFPDWKEAKVAPSTLEAPVLDREPKVAREVRTTQTVDLTKIERTIAKEPVYQSKSPKYCLLVFGPEAKTRVWLVLDADAFGDILFVGRNGNGDLTETDTAPKQGPTFLAGDITEADGK